MILLVNKDQLVTLITIVTMSIVILVEYNKLKLYLLLTSNLIAKFVLFALS